MLRRFCNRKSVARAPRGPLFGVMSGDVSELEAMLIAGGVFALVSLLCALGSHAAHWRKRFIDDIPRSKVRGVFVGMAEIGGAVECPAPLTAHLSGCSCVRYTFSVEEHWSRTVTEWYTDKDGNRRTRTRRESGWKTVDSGGDSTPFYVRDDTGALLVRPEGAEIIDTCVFEETCGRGDPLYYAKGPEEAVSDSDHRRRFTEHAIPVGEAIEVIGQARERRDVVAAEIAEDERAPMFLITLEPLVKVASGANLKGHFFSGSSRPGSSCSPSFCCATTTPCRFRCSRPGLPRILFSGPSAGCGTCTIPSPVCATGCVRRGRRSMCCSRCAPT